MMKKEAMNQFHSEMTDKLSGKFDLNWEIDKKGVVCGWCNLSDPDDLFSVAEIVAGFNGRVMTISPLNTPAEFVDAAAGAATNSTDLEDKLVSLVINYHFFFQRINCTVRITLHDIERSVTSITPVLKSADWHEREMQELYNIKLQGHPNSKRLFLEENIFLTDHTMIPLSEAMKGASTSTLWEKIMRSDRKEANASE